MLRDILREAIATHGAARVALALAAVPLALWLIRAWIVVYVVAGQP